MREERVCQGERVVAGAFGEWRERDREDVVKRWFTCDLTSLSLLQNLQ